MKINIANIFGGIIIALTITSCEDFLSREPIDKVNADTWFSSETDLLLYANGMLQSYLPSESTIGLGDAYCDLVATKHRAIIIAWEYGTVPNKPDGRTAIGKMYDVPTT